MSSYLTFVVAVQAFIMLGCFICALSDRLLASRVMAVCQGVGSLLVLPMTTALLAVRFGAGKAVGVVIGALLILFSAGVVEGLWRRRRWVMVLLGCVAVMPGTMLFLQVITGEVSLLRLWSLLSWLSLFGFCVLQLREVEGAAELGLTEPETDEILAVEGAV